MTEQDYLYCPLCRTELQAQQVFNQRRPRCPKCGFIHFRDPKVAVIALVTAHDRMLLIRRGVNPGKGLWALPGGFMDAGEMPEDALARELREEVGIQVVIDDLLGIFAMVGPEGTHGGIVLAYGAGVEAADLPVLRCDDDVIDARWFAAHQLPNDLAFESTMTLLARWRETMEQEKES